MEQRGREQALKHRFVNMTPILTQQGQGKNLLIVKVWFTGLNMITRCHYNF